VSLKLSAASSLNFPDSTIGDQHVGKSGLLCKTLPVDLRRGFDDLAASIEHAVANEAMSDTQSSGAHDDGRGGLMSNATSAAVDSAFNALAQTVLVHNARTLEDLVREMLRPMLKVWLDDNLPGMVERLVRAEIERVSRGRGG